MTPATSLDELLAPIPGDNPAGASLRYEPVYDRIKEARWADDPDSRGVWQHELKLSDWPAVVRLTESALAERSKDLQLAAWLTEARMKIEGFHGLAEGLALVRELVGRYWDSGLHPDMEDDECDLRCGVLEWLNRIVAAGISDIPLAHPSAGQQEYSLARWRQSQGEAAEEFADAISNSPSEELRTMAADAGSALHEIGELQGIVDAKLYDWSGFGESREAIEEYLRMLRRYIPEREDELVSEMQPPAPQVKPAVRSEPPRQTDGPTDGGRPAADSCGRDRFLRKLELAEQCLEQGRKAVATLILDELAEMIDECHLEVWESSVLIGRVWTNLYRCYRDAPAGSSEAERGARIFQRLCRLDPWQVLAAGED